MITDNAIVEMYWARSQAAIEETKNKYGRLIVSVAYRILGILEDAKECENDAYLRTWNSIPDARPEHLGSYVCKITRNLALDMYDSKNAAKRGGGEGHALLDDLAECLPDNSSSLTSISEAELGMVINNFLAAESPEKRMMFIKRYFYGLTISEIASELSLGESNVKMTLSRMRTALKKEL